MPAIPEKPSAHIELIPAAPEQESVLANLLELYAHDFSEFYPLELGSDGRFGYEQLSLYWSQPGRYPFIIRADGKLAGLVLVRKSCGVADAGDIWDIAEFFILRAFRRRGIGMKAASAVWERFPGRWEVRVMQSNRTAFHFWSHAISAFVNAPIEPVHIEKEDVLWQVFTFESS